MATVLSAVNFSVAKKCSWHQLVANERSFEAYLLRPDIYLFYFILGADYQRDLVNVIYWLIIIIKNYLITSRYSHR